MVAKHKELYNVDAKWNYFEVGHGKGACDGIGEYAKRRGDISVRSGKAIIQDAASFFSWEEKT